jgi:hypothetical protein
MCLERDPHHLQSSQESLRVFEMRYLSTWRPSLQAQLEICFRREASLLRRRLQVLIRVESKYEIRSKVCTNGFDDMTYGRRTM